MIYGGSERQRRIRLNVRKSVSACVQTVIRTKYGKTAGIAFSDGVELPLAVMLVKLTADDGCLNGEVLAQVVADKLAAVCLVNNSDKSVGHLSEILIALVCVIYGNCKVDFLDRKSVV